VIGTSRVSRRKLEDLDFDTFEDLVTVTNLISSYVSLECA
jgi:hypothetical protein